MVDPLHRTTFYDTKIGRTVNCNEEIRTLQMDKDRLGEWANMWQMEFNVDKCEVMHFGHKNGKMTLSKWGDTSGCSSAERSGCPCS